MRNAYRILSIPEQIQYEVSRLYAENKAEPRYDTYWFKTYDIDPENAILGRFPKRGFLKASFFVMKPQQFHKPHMDRGRCTAINLPIYLPEGSFTLIGNKPSIEDFQRESDDYEYEVVVPTVGETGVFKYDENLFSAYRFDDPVVLNTKWPHGVTNPTNEHRVIFTVGYTIDFETVLEELTEWL